MALVVIEGIDRTGKSTLADELVARLRKATNRGARIVHSEAPSPQSRRSLLNEYLTPLLEYRPGKQHLIFDRAHVGEAVWPKLFARKPKLSRAEYALLVAAFDSLGAVYVFTDRDWADLYKAFEEAVPPEPLDASLIPAAQGLFEAQQRYLSRVGSTIHSSVDVKDKDSVSSVVTSALDAEDRAERGRLSLPEDLTDPGLLPLNEAGQA